MSDDFFKWMNRFDNGGKFQISILCSFKDFMVLMEKFNENKPSTLTFLYTEKSMPCDPSF